MVVQPFIDSHGLAEKPWPLRTSFDILYGFDGAQQYRGGMTFALGDDVHAPVHAVDHVHVGVSGRAEHHFCPLGQSSSGVSREIVRTEIGFDFDNPADAFSLDEILPEEFSGDRNCVPVVKRARQLSHPGNLTFGASRWTTLGGENRSCCW